MTCKTCEDIAHSYSGKPFIPPTSGDINSSTYVCFCGQKWWQFNDYYHLWSTVDDDETFANIKAGCPRPVAIGNPSINVDKLIR